MAYLAFLSFLFSFSDLAGFFFVSFLVFLSFPMILPLNLSSSRAFPNTGVDDVIIFQLPSFHQSDIFRLMTISHFSEHGYSCQADRKAALSSHILGDVGFGRTMEGFDEIRGA